MIRRRQWIATLLGAGICFGGAPLVAHERFTRLCQKTAPSSGPAGSASSSKWPPPDDWIKIKPGMSEDDLMSLLGPPLIRETPVPDQGDDVVRLYRWYYGALPIASSLVPCQYRFTVFLHDRRVVETEQPFEMTDLTVLKYPAPSNVSLITPEEGQKFEHFPRVADFRWQPAVGEYPMSYWIEISVEQPPLVDDSGQDVSTKPRYFCLGSTRTEVPYFCTELPGSQGYKWRVRAANRHGKSDWTAPATFSFVQ
jgi:hypothetical protein